MFADDSNIFHAYPSNQVHVDLSDITNNLTFISDWCDANKITVNINKTNYMVIKSKRKKINIEGLVKIKGHVLNEVEVASFVGIHIDNYLTWKDHINRTSTMLRKKVGIIYRLRHFVPQYILLLLYRSFVQPHISYGLEVWGCTYKTFIDKIYVIQKMIVRAITFSGFMTSSAPLFFTLKILDIYKFHRYLTATFMYKLIHLQLPHPVYDYCKFFEHRYNTRQKDTKTLVLPKVKTEHGKRSISFYGSRVWNSLPLDVKEKPSVKSFCKELREMMLNEYVE